MTPLRLLPLVLLATSLAFPSFARCDDADDANDADDGTAATTQPVEDDAVDWLLDQATTAPSSPSLHEPTSQPTSPFAEKRGKSANLVRRGVITLSNGERIPGRISTTLGKPLRVWDEADKEYRDIPFALVRQLEAEIVWERDQREWHFKESGSDIKEYTGKTYPARESRYKVTLVNGQTVTGGIVAPLHVETKTEPVTFVLHKRDKGATGETLDQLVYVKRVEFPEEDKKTSAPTTQPQAKKGTQSPH